MLVLALPFAVEVEIPQDSSVTQLRVAGGGGHYLAVARDCSGDVLAEDEDSFYDVAASVDHKFAGGPASVGVSGGYLHDGRFPDDDGYYYVNPTIGLSWGRFGIAFGAAYFSKDLLDPDDADVNPVSGTDTRSFRMINLSGCPPSACASAG